MSEAVKACENGISIRKAAKSFHIPKSTLADRVSGKFSLIVTHGRPAAIAKDIEETIVKCVKIAADREELV